mgnify:CR=1 FL=1
MVKRIAYGILVAATVYVAVIYNSASMIFLAGVELLLPLFLFLLLIYQSFYQKLSFSKNAGFLEQGQTAQLLLHLENKSALPVRCVKLQILMENITTGKRKKRWIAAAGESRKIDIPILDHLTTALSEPGIWKISSRRLRIYDYLQLFWLPGRSRCETELIRLPEKQEICVKGSILAADTMWESDKYDPNQSGTDASHIRDIRDYQPGDRLSAIHWKLSARKEELLVKEYGQPIGCGLLLGLNFDQLDARRLTILYSLIEGLRSHHCNLLLTWKGAQDQQITEIAVMEGIDVYLAMEAVMRQNVIPFGEENRPKLPRRQLWLIEDALWLDEAKVEDFSKKADVKEQLSGLELTL